MTHRTLLAVLTTCALAALPALANAESTVASTDLSLIMDTATTSPLPGSNIVVDLTIFNEGDFAAEQAVVSIAIPDGLTFIGAVSTVGGSYDEQSELWSTGEIPSFTGKLLQLNLIVDADGPASITLIADLFSYTGAFGGQDWDSTPGNMNPCEDDYASLLFSAAGAPDAGPGDLDAGPTCGGGGGPFIDGGPGPVDGDSGPGPDYFDGGIVVGDDGSGGGCALTGSRSGSSSLLLLLFAFVGVARRRGRA